MTSQTLSGDLDHLRHELRLAARRRIERRARGLHLLSFVGLAGATIIIAAGAAFGAGELFGKPAPQPVKRDIAHVDAGLPADLRLNPDVAFARSVAGIRGATLYYASLKDGGYCTELVMRGSGRGAICTTATATASLPIEVTLPYPEPAKIAGSFVVYGRVNRTPAASLRVTYGDGSDQMVPLGDERFFVFKVPESKLNAAHSAMILTALKQNGDAVAHHDLTKVLNEGPAEPAPIELSTHTEHGNMARISGFDGRVTADGAASLRLVYPDGEWVRVPISSGARFDFRLPPGRFDDFTQPGELLARDARGKVVAHAWVAAPSYWMGRDRK